MIKFITYLTGNSDWNRFAPTLDKGYTPLPLWLTDLLGTYDVGMCACLYRLYKSKPQYADDLLGTDETAVMDAISGLTGGVLRLDGQGAASVKPSQPPFVGDKMCVADPVLTCTAAGDATIVVGSYTEHTQCATGNGITTVRWPSWLRLYGSIKTPSLPYTTTLPVVWSYPVEEVDRRLRKSSAAYDFMEEYDVVGLFFTETTAEGRLCAFLQAVLKHVNYLN
jgi:hypothetical protein